MSHINLDIDSLNKLNDILFFLQKDGLSSEVIDILLKQMIPRKNNKPLITYNPNNADFFYPAAFNPSIGHIDVSIEKLRSHIERDVNNLINDLCSHAEEAIRNYITIGIIAQCYYG